MESQIQIFENETFGKIRVLYINQEMWFVGKDIATALGYSNTRKALKDHVDEDDVTNRYPISDSLGRVQYATLVNESGMYSLILSSYLETAKDFKYWVTGTVLPSIRRHGAYMTDTVLENAVNNPSYTVSLFQRLQLEKNRTQILQNRVETMIPKAQYYDSVLQSNTPVSISVIAKDYGISAVQFNRLLHYLKIQYKVGGTWLLYQKYANKGYTISKTYHTGTKTIVHTYWTQKGREFLYRKLMCTLK